MISRLTAFAATFAVLATASLAYAANVQHATLATASAAPKAVRVIQLERVVITAKRLAPDLR
jgi:hypothetical protein